MIVTPGSIYSVEMRFDWTVRDSYGLVDVSVKSLTGDRHYGRRTIYFDRRPLTEINLYNFSASRACFSSVDVRYSKRTPRDVYRPDEEDSDSQAEDDEALARRLQREWEEEDNSE